MEDKIALVTGANSGIGYETALEIARQGARLILWCRNAERGEAARQSMVAETCNERVNLVIADLADLEQVRTAASQLAAELPHLDVLVNNAGLIKGAKREETAQGIEATFGVNHVAPFLLTSILFPLLKTAPEARVINVSSEAHRFANWGSYEDNLQLHTGYNSMRAYAISKMANALFSKELHRRLQSAGLTHITTNSLHPGVVNTRFGNTTKSLFTRFFQLVKVFSLSERKGALTSIYLATDPKASQHSGLYFEKQRPAKAHRDVENEGYAKRLWEESEQLAGTKFL